MYRIALIIDWLVIPGGSEKVVREILHLLRNHNVDVYTLMDFLDERDRNYFLWGKPTTNSFMQKIPGIEKRYRYFFPFFPKAIQGFDLKGYDLIISSSHSIAKGVRVHPGQQHLCYCHTPMRYLWDLQESYFQNKKLEKLMAAPLIPRIRKWDTQTAQNVTWFVANSENVRNRIQRNYNRESEVVYPPVDTDFFIPSENQREDFYVTASRMVPYKKMQLIIEAFTNMPDKRLVVIGDGPIFNCVNKSAVTSNVTVLRYENREILRNYFQRAKAFVFAAEEDFGITPVEAQACGTPVIAFRKGGTLETVIGNLTGVFFDRQDINSIISAVEEFEKSEHANWAANCRTNALRFSHSHFHSEFSKVLFDHTGIQCTV